VHCGVFDRANSASHRCFRAKRIQERFLQTGRRVGHLNVSTEVGSWDGLIPDSGSRFSPILEKPTQNVQISAS